MSNLEKYLNAVLTGDTSNLPEPITRMEKYLGAILGTYIGELPKPVSSSDFLFYEIAMTGGTGGDEALQRQIEILRANLATEQAENEELEATNQILSEENLTLSEANQSLTQELSEDRADNERLEMRLKNTIGADLTTNVTQAIADFDSIKAAIIAKGVAIDSEVTSEYADKIEEIEVGSGAVFGGEFFRQRVF